MRFGVLALPMLAGMASLDILPEDRKATEFYAKDRQWPAGAADLVNDDLRVAGWEFWFSECPNDVLSYGYRCENSREANHLIELLALIKDPGVTVCLSPEFGGSPPLKTDGRQYTVVLSIGSQKYINQWFGRLRLEEGSTTRRVWGVHRFDRPPTAQSPTLTIYLGTEEIELAELHIPAHIIVRPVISDRYREQNPDDYLIAQIEHYIAGRPATHPTTRPDSRPASETMGRPARHPDSAARAGSHPS